MVLDVSIQVIYDSEAIRVYPDDLQHLYTVHVDSKRILTVVTENEDVASKWLKAVLRSKHTNTKPSLPGAATNFRPDSIFVGLIAEERNPSFGPRPHDEANYTYDLLTLCVGSHCLMIELPGSRYSPYWDDEPPVDEASKLIKAFFQNPRVVVVGTNMAKTTRRLEARHGIKIENAVDLNQLAVKGMQRHDLDLARYDFEKLTMTVLGKEFDVYKPQKVDWYARKLCRSGYFRCRHSFGISNDKVMFTTVDAYLRLLMCFKLLELIDGPGESTSSSKKKKKKSNMKKATKRIQ